MIDGPMAEPGTKRRKVSTLAQVGDDAKRAAMRSLLLSTLKAQGWNLTATAKALGMSGPPDVIRAASSLGLKAHLTTARKRGAVSRQNRTE